MAKWRIYYQVGTMMKSLDFTGSQTELAIELGKYEFIMEVRRVYD